LCWSRLRYGGFLNHPAQRLEKFTASRGIALYYLKNFGIIFSWITAAGLALWVAQWFFAESQAGSSRSGSSHRSRRASETKSFCALSMHSFGDGRRFCFCFSAPCGHKEARYVMPLAPPLFLLAGMGLSVLLRGRQTLTRIVGPVVLAGVLVYSFLPVREHFQSPLIDPDYFRGNAGLGFF